MSSSKTATYCENNSDCTGKYGKDAMCDDTYVEGVKICTIRGAKGQNTRLHEKCSMDNQNCGDNATCVDAMDENTDEFFMLCAHNNTLQAEGDSRIKTKEQKEAEGKIGGDIRTPNKLGDHLDAKYGRCIAGGPIIRKNGRRVDKYMSAEYGGRRYTKYGYHCKMGMDMVSSGVPGGGCACCKTPKMKGLQTKPTYGEDRCGHVTPHVGKCSSHGQPWSYTLRVGSGYTCDKLPIDEAAKFVAGGEVRQKYKTD